ncbi:MAG: alpha/beta fold hydrolase [Sandaracinaceae bacterium]|nr:alpha/beta fold hydrolase [Sandaracinaceae bacterium]
MAERARPGDVVRAFWRQSQRGRQPEPRDALLARLDAVYAARGQPSPARLSAPERLEADERGPALQLERFEPTGARPSGATPTVVFAPGTNAYALLYAELLAALAARGVRAIGYDPRGHGASGGRRGSYTMDELVDDLARVVAHARARHGAPVFVAGSSQGGITALYYAARGGPIAGAICHNAADLADPTSLRLTRLPVSVSHALAPTLRRVARVLPELPVPLTAYLDLARERVEGLGSAREVIYADPSVVPFIRLRTLASLSSAKLARPVEAIDAPILLLHAGRDTIFPQDLVHDLFDRLPGPKQLRVYPDLPHYMVVDHVPRFVDDVVAWIDEIVAR